MIGVIIQARSGSTRFPRKIYEDINGKNTLQRVLDGVTKSQLSHKIILACPLYDQEEFRKRYLNGEFKDCTDERFATYFGSSDDLVDRYFCAARKLNIDIIVRVTCDCPLISGKIIDEMLLEYLKNGYNGFMGSNALVSSLPFPDGTDIEIFPWWMLVETYQLTQDPYNREHVTPYMYRRGTSYPIYEFKNCRPNTQISMRFDDFSFDTKEDLVLIKKIATEYDKHGGLDRAIKETVI